MKSCVIYANCQADGLALFLKRAHFPYDIQTFKNYQLILGEQSHDDLREAAASCDLFIYHPTAEADHGDASSDFYVRSVIPKSANHIAIPYAYNTGCFPLLGHGGKTYHAALVNASLRGRPLDAVLGEYEAGVFDFQMRRRFFDDVAEMIRREETMAVKISDWIVTNSNLRLFLNENHPSSVLFAELARRVFQVAVGHDCGTIPCDGENDANLPCTLPISQYAVKEFGWREKAHPAAHKDYRMLLELAWEEANE